MASAREARTPQAIVDGYEILLAYTRFMLDSARDGDWATLIEQERDYVLQVERLAGLDAELELDGEQRDRKAELLEAILENDLEIRQRLVERRDELSTQIGNAQRQQSVQRAYGAHDPAPPGPKTP